MPITSWNSRFNDSYPQSFKTRYRDLSSAIYDSYDDRDPLRIISDYRNKNVFSQIAIAGESYVAWLTNNLLGIANPHGGSSWADVYEYDYSDSDKGNLVRALGCRDDRDRMCATFEFRNTPGSSGGLSQNIAIANTLYNLSQCDPSVRAQENGVEPFVWTNDSLCVYDRYNFTDLEDFSAASGNPLTGLLTGTFAMATGGLVGVINNGPIGTWRDAFFNLISTNPNYNQEPYFTWNKLGNSVNIISAERIDNTVYVVTDGPHNIQEDGGFKFSSGIFQGCTNKPNGKTVIVTSPTSFKFYCAGEDALDPNPAGNEMFRFGKSYHMYTKACIPLNIVKEFNPELYYDHLAKEVAEGNLSYSSIPGSVEVGDKQPSPFLGLPFQPPVSVDIDTDNYFGFNYGDYSAPFNSWSQGIVNANYNLGAYAKLNKFWTSTDDSVCVDIPDFLGKNKGEYPLYGRIIIIPSGVGAGELGFILQDWYHFNDEPYNTENGTSTGNRYQSKAEWWESTVKTTMNVRFVHISSRPTVKVLVAASGPIYGDPNFYKGPNLSSVNNLSYDMLTLMLATSSLTRWL